ncbi:hypothetical protein EV700_2223 [Fluviicoccus keumensis]|uniref:START domain-containing protein n=1 Tax=Fluviicoccus keumensis TaxID=1435465 RepID=A0A4Q7YN64_9GAMM|nr:hypothetical protein [Fluviicoccus keumensis]RZU38293.1 hypothetical protein EV700_2223 [Fluviicoccus keumensis]
MIRLWLSLTLLCLATAPVFAQPAANGNDLDALRSRLSTDWLLVRNDRLHRIKTYARLEDGKRYRSFKVEATLDVRMEPLARVMLDFENYTRWFWKTLESRLLRKESATEYYVYMIHDAPYGLPDRDTILKAVIEPQTKNHPYVLLRTTAVPDMLPPKPPLVRVVSEEISVRFMPLPNQQVQLEVEGYFDPGGVIPPWAANLVQRTAPYAVVLAMQQRTDLPEYRQGTSPLPFPVYDYDEQP